MNTLALNISCIFASLNTVLFTLGKDVGTFSACTCFILECSCSFQVFLDAHLLLVDHDEGVEGDAEREHRYCIEIDGVLAHLDIITFSVSFFNLPLVRKEVLLTNWDYRCVAELVNGSEI